MITYDDMVPAVGMTLRKENAFLGLLGRLDKQYYKVMRDGAQAARSTMALFLYGRQALAGVARGGIHATRSLRLKNNTRQANLIMEGNQRMAYRCFSMRTLLE